MTTLYMDGFAHYGTGAIGLANMLSGPYAQVDGGDSNLVVAPYGAPDGTYALMYNNHLFPNTTARRVLPAPKAKLFMSFRYAVSFLPTVTDGCYICDWRDGSNNALYSLYVNTTGGLCIAGGDIGPGGTPLVSTAGPVIVPADFNFIETCYDTVARTITVRVNDAQATDPPVLTLTGISTTLVAQNTFISATHGGGGSNNLHYLTDLFVRDDQGTINNGWLGDTRVASLYMNADTPTSGWTPAYYKEFGTGICRLSYLAAGASQQNTNAYLSAAASTGLDPGSGDFTLETMIRFDALPSGSNYSSIFNRWDASGNKRSYRLVLGSNTYNNGCLQFDTSTDGTAATAVTKIQYPWKPLTDTWYHVALVRASGQLLLFVDGQQLGLPINDTDTYYVGTEPLTIGMELQTAGLIGGSNIIGRLDETRFTVGNARYTGPFTKPSAAFPRGAGDPNWAQVTLLMGYDSAIQDESSFTRTITANGGATVFLPTDGATVGKYSTVNKAIPDDNTFIQASLVNATNILTMTTQPSNGDTVTVGTKDGTVAAVYTFKTAIASAFDVLIDTSAQNTLMNLFYAINAGSGAGTKYGTGTTANYDVNAVQLPVGQIQVVANIAGAAANSITCSKTGTAASWATATLTGGANIPGPTNFKMQRPPNNTTVIRAVQTTVRALKTDAGTATIQSGLVGPLGGVNSGAAHALTVSPVYYGDIIETDPDTHGALSPTSIINGQFQVTRTA